MRPAAVRTGASKISPVFRGRLTHLRPDALQRVVVILQPDRATPRVRSRAAREAAIADLQHAVSGPLAEVEHLLEVHGGRKLRSTPDALGSLPVETTARGVAALAAAAGVKAVLEDQPISRLARPR